MPWLVLELGVLSNEHFERRDTIIFVKTDRSMM